MRTILFFLLLTTTLEALEGEDAGGGRGALKARLRVQKAGQQR